MTAKPYVMEGELNGKPFTREFYSKEDYDAIAERLADTESALERETALFTEAKRHNADLMEIINTRDEALGFIPLDKGFDMQDELREVEARLAEAERKNLTAASALVKAFNELNAIRARDGVPRDYLGMKTGVSEEYFSSVVDDVDAAVLALTGLGAHCHPLLYERATDSASDPLTTPEAIKGNAPDPLIAQPDAPVCSFCGMPDCEYFDGECRDSADAVPHCGNCGRDGCPYCDPRLTTTVDGVK